MKNVQVATDLYHQEYQILITVVVVAHTVAIQ